MKKEQQAFPDEFNNGMSLRDYFAAQALTGLVTIFGIPQEGCRTLSKRAYEIADSMLKEREA